MCIRLNASHFHFLSVLNSIISFHSSCIYLCFSDFFIHKDVSGRMTPANADMPSKQECSVSHTDKLAPVVFLRKCSTRCSCRARSCGAPASARVTQLSGEASAAAFLRFFPSSCSCLCTGYTSTSHPNSPLRHFKKPVIQLQTSMTVYFPTYIQSFLSFFHTLILYLKAIAIKGWDVCSCLLWHLERKLLTFTIHMH